MVEGEQVERSTRLSLKALEELEFSGSLATWIGPETWGSEGQAEGGAAVTQGHRGRGGERIYREWEVWRLGLAYTRVMKKCARLG